MRQCGECGAIGGYHRANCPIELQAARERAARYQQILDEQAAARIREEQTPEFKARSIIVQILANQGIQRRREDVTEEALEILSAYAEEFRQHGLDAAAWDAEAAQA